MLVAVAGNIAILGDMYAFGLLGAFSLTCVALDVIRWRERHGEAHVGSTEEDDEHAGQVVEQVAAQARGAARWSRRLAPVLGRFDPETLDRPHAVWVRIRAGGTEVAQALHPVAVLIRRVWPDLKFSLGLLTTVLVCGAWAINLKSKPLATGFGGGLTILGVAVSIVHYRYQQQRGQQPIFLMSRLRPIRRSILVVLAADSARNREVVRAAIEGADGHTLVFLYLGRPQPREVQPFKICTIRTPSMRRRSAPSRRRGPRPGMPMCRRSSPIALVGRIGCWTPGVSSARMRSSPRQRWRKPSPNGSRLTMCAISNWTVSASPIT